MTQVAPRDHPGPEVLAAFIEGRLEGEELAATADHLTGCTECRGVLREAAVFEREQQTALPARRVRRWWLVAAAAALAVGVTIPRWRDPLNHLQPESFRSYEGRITAFHYAPLGVARAASHEEDYERLSAAGELQKRVKSDRTAGNLHRLGIADVALGRAQTAVDLLNEAARMEPANAAILSDLSAAQLGAGLAQDAAESAARAVKLDPALPAAAFNLALTLEAVANRPDAIQAWERYLALDGASEWAVEARKHVEDLREPQANWERDLELFRKRLDAATAVRLATQYPQRMRYWVQEELLPAWAASHVARDLAVAQAAGETRARSGDSFLQDVVSHAAEMTPQLRNALDAFARATATSHRREIDAAAAQYAEAAQLLARAGSPLSLEADVHCASNDFYGGRNASAIDRLTSVENRIGSKASAYPSVMAEIEWVRGLIAAASGKQNQALMTYRRALAWAQRAGAIEHEVAISGYIANHLDRMGDSAEAGRYRLDVLRRNNDIGAEPARMYVAYSQAGLAELRAGRPRLALTFIDSQYAIAIHDKDPLLIAESLAARALAYRDLHESDAAVAALDEARTQARRVRSAGLRDRVESDTDFIAGTLYLKSQPRRAVAALDAALSTWEKYQWNLRAATGRLVRGNASILLRDRAAAEADFRAGIQDVERERVALQEPALRIAYFEQSYDLFDRLTELLIDERRMEDAFGIAERKRARYFLDRLSQLEAAAGKAPLSAREIAAAVPADTALLQVTLLDRGIVSWCIARGEMWFAHGSASRIEVTKRVAAFRDAIAANDVTSLKRDGAWLFEQTIGPLEPAIGSAAALAVIPDGELYGVPFAALVTPDSRYLIERWSVAVSPSASTFVRSLAASRSAKSLVAVAEPAPDADLPRLPYAEKETRNISRMYPGASVFVGGQMTAESFLAKARDADVIHFAGHTSHEDADHGQSSLLFGMPRSALTAEEIAKCRLQRRPVVVLAACDSGAGVVRKTEGLDSLSAAFLYAGARGVVGALWKVDDVASTALFDRFHRNLAGGCGPSESLRQAQLSMIQSANPRERQVSSWAVAVFNGAG